MWITVIICVRALLISPLKCAPYGFFHTYFDLPRSWIPDGSLMAQWLVSWTYMCNQMAR